MSKFYFMLLFLGLSVIACQNETVKKDLIFADWTLSEGFRNNKPSNMLEGIYFNLKAPSTVKTNFMGLEETGSFVLEDKKLTVQAAQKTVFDVNKLTEKSLELETIIKGIPFRFVLQKK